MSRNPSYRLTDRNPLHIVVGAAERSALRRVRWRDACPAAYCEGVRDHLPPGLPPDPFADDPCDPSAALDDVEPGQPLDAQERTAVEADLADLAVYEALLAHRGIRGLVVCCDECQQDHYHDWDMLRANLLQLLIDGTVRPHEPAYDPEPDAYVTWDYCRGYADASLNEASYEAGSDAEGFPGLR